MNKYFWILLGIYFSIISSSSFAVQISFDANAEGGTGGTFNGLLLEARGNPDVGIILMHGRANLDGAVVRQLRNSLNSAGYTTLSIGNPDAGVDTDLNGNNRDFADYAADENSVKFAFPETYARIAIVMAHLATLGVTKIVLVGFSMGSSFTSAHFANGQQLDYQDQEQIPLNPPLSLVKSKGEAG